MLDKACIIWYNKLKQIENQTIGFNGYTLYAKDGTLLEATHEDKPIPVFNHHDLVYGDTTFPLRRSNLAGQTNSIVIALHPGYLRRVIISPILNRHDPDLESHFAEFEQNPNYVTLYRFPDGSYAPDYGHAASLYVNYDKKNVLRFGEGELNLESFEEPVTLSEGLKFYDMGIWNYRNYGSIAVTAIPYNSYDFAWMSRNRLPQRAATILLEGLRDSEIVLRLTRKFRAE